MKHELPLSLRIVRGAIGKEFVIKYYKYGVIKTKFPDMTRIIASMQQRKCRNLFKDAVAYAKEVIADPERKQHWQKRIRIRNGVYNDAIKYHMLKDKRAKEAAMAEATRLLRMALSNAEKNEINNKLVQQNIYLPLNNQSWQTIKNTPANKTGSG